ncbi:hypothetical protein, partial [Bacillus altitudinis]|uniref:hypothetical protein n=1 Tax=Bacillus altitudinis TaxID=293387 RepID=UPI001C92F771
HHPPIKINKLYANPFSNHPSLPIISSLPQNSPILINHITQPFNPFKQLSTNFLSIYSIFI